MHFGNYHIRLINNKDSKEFYQLIQNNLKRLEDTFAGTVAKTKAIDKTEEFIEDATKKVRLKMYFPFVIIDKPSRKLIGFIDIKNIDWKIPKAEIGYYIDSNYDGRGIASNALKIMVDYSFDTLKINKLFIRTTKDNIGSQKVAEKNGFEKEGYIRQDYKTTSGEIVDLIYYGLIRNLR